MKCERVDLGGGKVAIVCSSRPLPKPKKEKPKAVTLPATRQQLVEAGWKLCYSRNCRLCHRPIDFWYTPKGAYMPMDMADADGLRRSHFETCPDAEKFRREKPESKQGGLFK